MGKVLKVEPLWIETIIIIIIRLKTSKEKIRKLLTSPNLLKNEVSYGDAFLLPERVLS